MADQVFNDQEDQATLEVKNSLYYPTSTPWQTVRNAVKDLGIERAGEVVDTAIEQVGFEQKQRRDYIISSCGINHDLVKPTDSDVFVRTISEYGSNPQAIIDSLNQAKIDTKQFSNLTISPEVIEQAATYNTVASSLERMYSQALYESKVRPIITALRKLPPEQLENLINQLRDFLHRVVQLGDDILLKDPEFSPAVKDALSKAGLSIIADKLESIGDRLKFSNNVLLVARLMEINNKQDKPLSEEQIGQAAGQWIYTSQGAPIAEELLSS